MIESFEAGNTNVLRASPYYSHFGTHSKKVGRYYFATRGSSVRVRLAPLVLALKFKALAI